MAMAMDRRCLRADRHAGHGIGSRAQQDRAAADTDALLLWQTTAAAQRPA